MHLVHRAIASWLVLLHQNEVFSHLGTNFALIEDLIVLCTWTTFIIRFWSQKDIFCFAKALLMLWVPMLLSSLVRWSLCACAMVCKGSLILPIVSHSLLFQIRKTYSHYWIIDVFNRYSPKLRKIGVRHMRIRIHSSVIIRILISLHQFCHANVFSFFKIVLGKSCIDALSCLVLLYHALEKISKVLSASLRWLLSSLFDPAKHKLRRAQDYS